MNEKLYKVICRETEFCSDGEVLFGWFSDDEENYFEGVSFLYWNGNWIGGGTLTYSKTGYQQVAVVGTILRPLFCL